MKTKRQFTAIAQRWLDKVNGNTYHSVRVIRHTDDEVIVGQFQYGYGDHYRQTALAEMLKAGWLPDRYNENNIWLYERENDYPIIWNVSDGLKRDCIANGKALQ